MFTRVSEKTTENSERLVDKRDLAPLVYQFWAHNHSASGAVIKIKREIIQYFICCKSLKAFFQIGGENFSETVRSKNLIVYLWKNKYCSLKLSPINVFFNIILKEKKKKRRNYFVKSKLLTWNVVIGPREFNNLSEFSSKVVFSKTAAGSLSEMCTVYTWPHSARYSKKFLSLLFFKDWIFIITINKCQKITNW